MGAFFTAILGKIVGFAAWIGALAVACFAAWWLLGTDLFAWLFEQVLDIAISALNALDVDFQQFNPGNYIGGLPPELVNMLGLLRVGEAFTIIASAAVIRITLQLIPFTRLGS